MTKGPPGLQQTDDEWVANRVAEAVAAACAFEDVHVYADTFADVDRGYYRRHGVVDRFYNPRPGFEVVRQLTTAFAELRSFSPGKKDTQISLTGEAGQRFELIREPSSEASGTYAVSGRLIDLYTGNSIPATRNADGEFQPQPTSPLCLWATDGEDVRAIK